MNKEQLINQLQELNSHLPKGDLDDVRISNQTAITELENKIANNDNYISNKAKFRNNGRLSNLSRSLERANTSLLTAQHDFDSLQKKISTTEEKIAKVAESNSIAIAELENQLLEIGRESRRLQNPTAQQDEEINRRLEIVRGQIANLRSYEAELRGNLVEYQAELDDKKTELEKAEKKKNRYQSLLNNFEERVNNEGSNIDLISKMKDEDELASLIATKEALEDKANYSSIDFSNEIDNMINQLQNDEISMDEVYDRLNRYKEQNLSSEVLEYINSNRDDELNKLNLLRSDLSMEVANLETKLSDSNNYILSSFVSELNEDRILNATENMNELESEITSLNDQIYIYNTDVELINRRVKMANENVNILRDEIDKWNLQISYLNPDTDQDLIQSLNVKIASNEAEISEQQKLISGYLTESLAIKEQIASSTNIKNVKEERFTRYKELIDKMQQNNDKTVDLQAKRLDENRLSQLKSNLSALDNRIAFAGYDFASELNLILEGRELISNVASVDENTLVEEPVINNDTTESPVVEDDAAKESVDETSSKEESLDFEYAPIENGDDALSKESYDFEYAPIENRDETSIVPIDSPMLDDFIPVASFEPASDELKFIAKSKRLLEKIKDKLNATKEQFKENWKKYVAVAVSAASIILAARGIGAIVDKNKDAKSDLDNLNNKDDIQSESSEENKSEIEEKVDNAIENNSEIVVKPEESIIENNEQSSEVNNEIDREVNKKSNEEIAREVINGDWGNDLERRRRLTEAGYDYATIQAIVDNMLKNENNNQSENKKPNKDVISEKEEIIEDNKNTEIPEIEEIIHEEKPDTSIKPGESITGGEVIDEKTEEVIEEIVEGEEITGGELISEEEEVVEDNVVLPDGYEEDKKETTEDETNEDVNDQEIIDEKEEVIEEEVLPDDGNRFDREDIVDLKLDEGEEYNYVVDDSDVSFKVDSDGEINGDAGDTIVDIDKNEDGTIDVILNEDDVVMGDVISEEEEVIEDNPADLSALLGELGLDENTIGEDSNSIGGR